VTGSIASVTGDPERDLDTGVPHIARMYNYWLGGTDNFAADRAAADAAVAAHPGLLTDARANRAFLGRTVRFLAAEARVRQFLDIGTGIPAAGNTHEVAQAVAPECRVVYVDNDPMVLARAGALPRDTTRAEVSRFFTGLELVPPGIVPVHEWRPDPGSAPPAPAAVWGAVGRKP
jgi:S-adenosyl methyltransferase